MFRICLPLRDKHSARLRKPFKARKRTVVPACSSAEPVYCGIARVHPGEGQREVPRTSDAAENHPQEYSTPVVIYTVTNAKAR